jgi:hypothetical protein
MTFRAAIALVAAACMTASCAASLAKLPAGPGAPAHDGDEALQQALTACQRVTSFSAELSVRGRIGSRRVRSRLNTGLVAPATAYLEAPAPFGSPFFVFFATADDATLLLPRDRRALQHGRSSEVLEAITGVPLGPTDLRATLTGCATDAHAAGALRPDERWRLITGDSDLYLRRDHPTDPWRLVAAVRRNGKRTWRTDYSDFRDGLPRAIRLTSGDVPALDMQLSLAQVEINVPLDPAALRVQIPAGTAAITLEELRDSGPLATAQGASRE